MTNNPTKTYLVGVIERALTYYKVEAEDARSAAENWQDADFHDRDDEALDTEGPCNVREKQPDGKFIMVPPLQWQAEATIDFEAAWIDTVRYARTWVQTARDVLAQPGRTAMVDHLLELGLGQIAAALAQAGSAEPPTLHPGNKPYSVLLFYPDYANDDGTETFYAWVEAPDSIQAIAEARRQAVAVNDCIEIEPDDFAPLLVTEGHIYGQPLSNE